MMLPLLVIPNPSTKPMLVYTGVDAGDRKASKQLDLNHIVAASIAFCLITKLHVPCLSIGRPTITYTHSRGARVDFASTTPLAVYPSAPLGSPTFSATALAALQAPTTPFDVDTAKTPINCRQQTPFCAPPCVPRGIEGLIALPLLPATGDRKKQGMYGTTSTSLAHPTGALVVSWLRVYHNHIAMHTPPSLC